MGGSSDRRLRTEQRKAEILAAALDAVLDVGDSGTFVHEVCARAGVSVGTLYHHFGSKDQLIATLHYSILNDYQRGAGAILAADPAAEDGIKETVGYHVRWLVRHPRQASFLLQQPFAGQRSARVPADMLEENAIFLSTVHAWLDRRMEGSEMRRMPFDLVVALLIGPVHQWVRGALYRGGPSPAAVKRAVADLGDGAWQALKPTGLLSPRPSGTHRRR